MRRRAIGIGALQKERQRLELFQQKGNDLAKEELEKLKEQMEEFRSYLEKFALKYKKDIKKSGEFRKQFQLMCAAAGVDPLKSSNSYWAKLLGVGDFYYQLTIQINEVFLATSHQNGGIMTMDELLIRVNKSRNVSSYKSGNMSNNVTKEDILESTKKLSLLGGNVKLIPSSGSYIIHATPSELNTDQLDIIKLASNNDQNVSFPLIIQEKGWSVERIKKAIDELIIEGVIWVDQQDTSGVDLYWLPILSNLKT